ncbi:uncharacterized protein PHALS_00021 [Plasmopara halstedii]|uniref:Uncharacterized protein n=1 Tax=Plasmopara halstedii TaxID=4781 RepID=A0A0P1A6A1_PLAHL|nr:uncharacterized protein PHALS_00021 [Plasmopara halstedii]CEG35686.1 hypothetical protein PHALS_00021 [Plasmopara halstedii]|eukprot:XP_024572055.1 hypothetical protein PHALS_00021 [Plasmopara halstedii]
MTTQLTDEFLHESATAGPDQSVSVLKGKSMSYVIDLNQGSYTKGIVTLDATNQLNGSQGYASLRDAYITVPFVATIKNTGAGALAGTAAAMTQFVAGLKCNIATIIDKVQIELNGKTIVTPSGYLSHWNNLRAMTEWSDDDMMSARLGFHRLLRIAETGFINNANNVAATLAAGNASAVELPCNTGFVKRELANPPVVSVNGTAATPTG